MEPKWKLFVMPDCGECESVKKWLDNHDTIEGLEIIVVNNDDTDILAETDFYDVFDIYPALRPANGAGGWDGVKAVLGALRKIAAGKE